MSIYEGMKGQAYSILAIHASCDHQKAKAKGYSDGWQMLLDKHDDDEMAAFCLALPNVLSPSQAKVLLDGLAKEYTEFETWDAYAQACANYPEWRPSHETITQYRARTGS